MFAAPLQLASITRTITRSHRTVDLYLCPPVRPWVSTSQTWLPADEDNTYKPDPHWSWRETARPFVHYSAYPIRPSIQAVHASMATFFSAMIRFWFDRSWERERESALGLRDPRLAPWVTVHFSRSTRTASMHQYCIYTIRMEYIISSFFNTLFLLFFNIIRILFFCYSSFSACFHRLFICRAAEPAALFACYLPFQVTFALCY